MIASAHTGFKHGLHRQTQNIAGVDMGYLRGLVDILTLALLPLLPTYHFRILKDSGPFSENHKNGQTG
jgi:cytochrome c biogenesis protein CcdA